jgi:hypothetical protein
VMELREARTHPVRASLYHPNSGFPAADGKPCRFAQQMHLSPTLSHQKH